MFSHFPKTRQPLPSEYAAIYEKHYKSNRDGKTVASSVSQRMETWMHRQVAKSTGENLRTLEIGAGTLNHLSYERTQYYDIVEPFEVLYQSSPLLSRVCNVYSDISEIPSEGGYDRIISIATFEHILNLPDVVAETCRLLNNGGVLYVAVPNEGRFLWKAAYTVSTGMEFKLKYGLDYRVIMNYEHCNTADEVEDVIRHFYDKVNMKVFGFSRTMCLYRYFECKKG